MNAILSSTTKANWPKEAVLDLISAVKTANIIDKKKKSKVIYKKVHDIMNEKGYYYSIKQIINKYKKMKGEYQKIVARSTRSGNRSEGRKWEYFLQMQDILGNRPRNEILLASTTNGIDSTADEPEVDLTDVLKMLNPMPQDDTVLPEEDTTDTSSGTSGVEEQQLSETNATFTEDASEVANKVKEDGENCSHDDQPGPFVQIHNSEIDDAIDRFIAAIERQAQLDREASKNQLDLLLRALDATTDKFIAALKQL